jgi:hypothetical protein
MPITPIPAMPDAPAPTDDRATFTAKSFAYFAALPDTTESMNVLGGEVEALAEQADADAAAAEAARAEAVAAASAASGFSTASKWVSGTAYADGAVVWSPTNYLSYRRNGAGGGTTDPAADPVNWSPLNVLVPFTPVTTSVQLAETGGRYSLQRTTTEGAGTNLFIYSEQLDNAAWTKNGVTVTANTTDDPNGELTADTVTTTSSTPIGAYTSILVTPSGVNDYFGSVFCRKGTSSNVKVDIYYPTNPKAPLLFNFDTHVISGGAYAGEYIAEYFGNGWWRLGYRVLRDASANKSAIILLVTPNDGVSGRTIHVWGAQIEAGAAATSYIRSVAAPGTRAAGSIPPQRIVLPEAPVANAMVSVQIGNGIETNVIHPNGSTLEGTTGPALLDFATGLFDFQYINNTWRAV